MSGSLFFSITLRHHAWILYLFYGSPTSCPDPFSFWWIFGILSRSSIVLTTLWHCVWISFHFDGSPASCMDPLSFRRLSSIVSRSSFFSTNVYHRVQIPFLFRSSQASYLDPLSFRCPFFSVALRYLVRILYHFGDSPALCPNPFSFWWLSSIVFGSPIFSAVIRHCV